MSRRFLVFALVPCLLATLLVAAPVVAHPERPAEFPAGALGTPSYRFDGNTYVVCKPDTEARLQVLPEALRTRNEAVLDDCAFEHINEAIAEVEANGEQGSRILVMPGVYREEPYVGLQEFIALTLINSFLKYLEKRRVKI